MKKGKCSKCRMIRVLVYHRLDMSNKEYFEFKLCLKCATQLLSSALDSIDGKDKTNLLHHACGMGNGCKQ